MDSELKQMLEQLDHELDARGYFHAVRLSVGEVPPEKQELKDLGYKSFTVRGTTYITRR